MTVGALIICAVLLGIVALVSADEGGATDNGTLFFAGLLLFAAAMFAAFAAGRVA